MKRAIEWLRKRPWILGFCLGFFMMSQPERFPKRPEHWILVLIGASVFGWLFSWVHRPPKTKA